MSENPISDFIAAVKVDLVHSLQSHNRVASGKTIEAIEQVDEGEKSSLLVPKYVDYLEKGRPPTSPDAPKGDPTVFDQIQEWVAHKGIPIGAAWAITQNIHKNGYPGTPGVLTTPLSDDNLNKRADEAASNLADILLRTTLNL